MGLKLKGLSVILIRLLPKDIMVFDIISGRNFYVDITDQIGRNLTINATSSDMYVQYQYVNDDKGIILASGSIKDNNFGNDYISFELSPVVNNTETTYDLYYLGKTNVYNDICQKVAFILENSPISTITFKGNDNFDLKFENIQFKTGYYLIKGNNVITNENNISFSNSFIEQSSLTTNFFWSISLLFNFSKAVLASDSFENLTIANFP